MNNSNDYEQLGDYSIYGYLRNPDLIERIAEKLPIKPTLYRVSNWGWLFYSSSYGDIAETDEAVVLKLGFLRASNKTPLFAQTLVDRRFVSPSYIQTDGISGNGAIIVLSKKEPSLYVFETLMSVHQVYYSSSRESIFCSDVLRCLAKLAYQREVNEDILPQHFLFRSVYGNQTYFKGIERLIPGYRMAWVDGYLDMKLQRSLDAVATEAQYIRNEKNAIKLVDETMRSVVADYNNQVLATQNGAATLLSGGVDSSLVQYYLNATDPLQSYRSISFAIQVPAFAFEVEYAREASQILHTQHTFVNYSPSEYPQLLTRVIDSLAQPPNLETEPSFLAVSEAIRAANWQEKYFFTGQGGDTLFGGEAAIKLQGIHYSRYLPFALPLLKTSGTLLARSAANLSHMLLKGAQILASEGDPDAYVSPMNDVCVYVLGQNREIIQRWFGDDLLRKTLAERRALVAQYSNSRHHLDQVYFIDLSTDLWELGVQRQQLFLANHIHQISPFFDEDLIKAALSIDPRIRYIKGVRYKYLLKALLKKKVDAPVATKRKGPSTVNDDLEAWMREGPLRPLVEDISRPNFVQQKDFDLIKRRADYFLWPLLTYDLFRKRVIGM
jgi:asparagine synthase (glutamine-hydrolysing)